MRFCSIPALACLVVVAACDTGGFDPIGMGSSPARPEVSLAKEVTTVSAAEIAGSWTCRELNPYPDMPAATTRMTLSPDGSLTAEATVPMGEQVPGAGDMLMTWTGNWAVEGDRLITSGGEVETIMADGADTGLAGLMNQLMARYSDRAGDGDAEIFRVTASELVMRDREPDAPAVACLREA